MKSSSIRFRVADFLKQYAPFDVVSEQDLLDLAMGGRVKFHECDEIIFQQGAQRGPYLFVIQQGTVRLLDSSGDSEMLKDLLGEGDLVGIGQLFGDKRYRYTAKTSSDAILYALRVDTFEGLMARYPTVARYLTAYFSVRRDRSLTRQDSSTTQLAITASAADPSWLMEELPFADALHKRLLTCSASTPIREVAKKMGEHCRDAAAVVDQSGQTKGIITAEVLRDRVATGDVSPQADAEVIMRPLCTFAPAGKAIADYLLQLADSRKRYVGITQAGDGAAPLIGLLSETDLTLHGGVNPVTVLREVTQAERIDELARLRSILASTAAARCGDGATMEWYSRIMSVFDRQVMIRIVRLARAELAADDGPFPDITHCWLFLGTAGRKELLIRKAPDWSVVYADPQTCDEALISEAFAALGRRIDAMLDACGYPQRGDQSGVCRSLSGWKDRYRCWIHDPVMSQSYRSLGSFDLLPIDGDASLASRLKQSIKAELDRDESNFVPLMANDAMAHLPPLTFFHGQVVDDHGERSNRFDLRHSTLQPLVDIARVLALEEGWIGGESTAERLEKCAAARPEHQALFKEAAEAFRVALRLYALTLDAERGDDPTIDPNDLSRYEQQLFKSIFRSILALLHYSADHYRLIPRR